MSDKVVLNGTKRYRVVVRFYDSPLLKNPASVLDTKIPLLRDLGLTSVEFVGFNNRLVKMVVNGSGLAIARWLRQLNKMLLALNQGFRAWWWDLSELIEVDLTRLPTRPIPSVAISQVSSV